MFTYFNYISLFFSTCIKPEQLSARLEKLAGAPNLDSITGLIKTHLFHSSRGPNLFVVQFAHFQTKSFISILLTFSIPLINTLLTCLESIVSGSFCLPYTASVCTLQGISLGVYQETDPPSLKKKLHMTGPIGRHESNTLYDRGMNDVNLVA